MRSRRPRLRSARVSLYSPTRPQGTPGMRTLVIALLLIASPLAWAQSPEEAYLAARVQAGTALEEMAKAADAFDTTKPDGGTWYTAHDQARSVLEAQFRRVMGPIPSPKGFSGSGTFSPDTLCCWPGVGLLDGILFRTSATDTRRPTRRTKRRRRRRRRTSFSRPRAPSRPRAARLWTNAARAAPRAWRRFPASRGRPRISSMRLPRADR